MDKCKTFTNNLEALVEQRANSLTEFAHEIGVPRTTLQSIKSRENMSLNTAFLLADGLGMSLDELASDTKIPEKFEFTKRALQNLDWYISLPKNVRKNLHELLNKCLEALDE